MSLVSSPSWGVAYEDLVKRAGLYYEKFTSTPFTGEVDEELIRDSIKNGKREGSFESYYDNGQPSATGSWGIEGCGLFDWGVSCENLSKTVKLSATVYLNE